MTSSQLMFLLLMLGMACASFALVVRRAETARPDPSDIHVRTGLMHMLVGIMAWGALLSLMAVAIFVMGLVLPGIAIALIAFALTRNYGSRLFSVYRTQIALAITALLIAIVQWLYLITLIQADPFQIR